MWVTMRGAQRAQPLNTNIVHMTSVVQPGPQAGEPATTVHFVEEGRVLVAANFLNLPEAQRAVDFPETLLTDSLEWCARTRSTAPGRRGCACWGTWAGHYSARWACSARCAARAAGPRRAAPAEAGPPRCGRTFQFGPGAVLGSADMFLDGPARFRAVAAARCRVLRLSESGLHRLAAERPRVRAAPARRRATAGCAVHLLGRERRQRRASSRSIGSPGLPCSACLLEQARRVQKRRARQNRKRGRAPGSRREPR